MVLRSSPSITAMPSKKTPSSMTYPSAPGSDVRRSASFWSLPSVVSTPACSEHSVQTQRSKDNRGRLKILLEYPAHSRNTRVLEEAEIWRAEKLRVKLSAMADACREWEDALAKSVLVRLLSRYPCVISTLTQIRHRMATSCLRLAPWLPARLQNYRRARTRHSRLLRRIVSSPRRYRLLSFCKI